MNELISVVMPLFNMQETVVRAVNSVLAQAHRNWELIVIDDGSTDRGPSLVSAIADARILLKQQANRGVSAARNVGLESARGDYVAFLDADDLWEPDHLSILTALTKAFPGGALYGAAYFTIDGANKRATCRASGGKRGSGPLDDYFRYATRFGPPLNSSSVLVPRQTLCDIGGFPLGVGAGEDLLTWARLASIGPVVYSPRPTAVCYLPLVAAGVRDQHLRRLQRPDVVGDNLERLANSESPLADSIGRYLAVWFRMRAMVYLELNERRDTLLEIQRAIAWSRPVGKDLALLCLWLLPFMTRKLVLAKIRKLRGRE